MTFTRRRIPCSPDGADGSGYPPPDAGACRDRRSRDHGRRRLHDGRGAPVGRGRRGPRRPDRRGGHGTGREGAVPEREGAPPPPGPDGAPGLPGLPSPRAVRRPVPAARLAPRPARRGRLPRRGRRLRAGQPRAALDLRRWLADVPLPGRHADERAARRHRSRPAGVPAEPRRPRSVGELEGLGGRPHHARDRRPVGRADRARSRDRRADRHPARGCRLLVRGCPPPPAATGGVGASDPARAGASPRPRDHRVAGRLGHAGHGGGLPLARRAR